VQSHTALHSTVRVSESSLSLCHPLPTLNWRTFIPNGQVVFQNRRSWSFIKIPGIPACRGIDRIPQGRVNPKGAFESQRLWSNAEERFVVKNGWHPRFLCAWVQDNGNLRFWCAPRENCIPSERKPRRSDEALQGDWEKTARPNLQAEPRCSLVQCNSQTVETASCRKRPQAARYRFYKFIRSVACSGESQCLGSLLNSTMVLLCVPAPLREESLAKSSTWNNVHSLFQQG